MLTTTITGVSSAGGVRGSIGDDRARDRSRDVQYQSNLRRDASRVPVQRRPYIPLHSGQVMPWPRHLARDDCGHVMNSTLRTFVDTESD